MPWPNAAWRAFSRDVEMIGIGELCGGAIRGGEQQSHLRKVWPSYSRLKSPRYENKGRFSAPC
jgi:hypothetical protein